MDAQHSVLETEVAQLIEILMDAEATADNDSLGLLDEAILSRYATQIGRIGEVATEAADSKLAALGVACDAMRAFVDQLAAAGATADRSAHGWLEEWPLLAMGFVNAPDEDEMLAALQAQPEITPEPSAAQGLADAMPDNTAGEIDGVADDTAAVHDQPPLSNHDAGDETDFIRQQVAELLAILEPLYGDSESEQQAGIVERYGDQLLQIAAAASEAGYDGMLDLALPLQERLEHITADPADLAAADIELLEAWPTAAMAFLDKPSDSSIIAGFARQLQQVSAGESSAPTVFDGGSADSSDTVFEFNPDLPTLDADAPADISVFAESDDPLLPEGLAGDADAEDAISDDAIGAESPIDAPAFEHLPQNDDPAPELPEPATDDSLFATGAEPTDAALGNDDDGILFEPSGVTEPEAVETGEVGVFSDIGSAEPPQESAFESSEELDHTIASDEPVAVNQEFIELLSAEVLEITEQASTALAPALASGDDDAFSEALGHYNDSLERLAEVSAAIGLDGLSQVCGALQANQALLAQQTPDAASSDLLLVWPQQVLDYLTNIEDTAGATRLAQTLGAEGWPLPLDADQVTALAARLSAVQLSTEVMLGEERQTEATAEDVSLQLPGGVNQDLLDSLLAELPMQTAEFTAVIQRFVERRGSREDVDHAQRLAHTLKGAANTVGVPGIANLTHHSEDILQALAKHDAQPSRSLADALMNVADCLESMSESLLGMTPPPADARQTLQLVLDWANRIDREGVPANDDEEPPVAVAPEPTSRPIETPAAASATTDAAGATEESRGSDSQVPMLRVPAPMIDELLRLVGESIILTGQIQDRIDNQLTQTLAVREQNAQLQQLVGELEDLVDVQGVTGRAEKRADGGGNFDPLEMEQYNELHTVTHRLVELAVDARVLDESISANFDSLETLLIDQSQLHRESQEAVLRTRMVPVKTVVPRLQRSVRQTCRLTDKDVELHVSGEQTLIDSNILADMIDPLMHVLRNAIDHGIEDASTRARCGKPTHGRIDLTFQREGNNIVVRCQDDGGGLDYDAIRQTAITRGVITDKQVLSDAEMNRLILQSGFSTRSKTTQVSGRGVGMDAVYSQVLAIKGGLNIESEAERGCKVELRLPLTLLSTHAMLIEAGGKQFRFAVSERGVEQILHATSGKLQKVGDALAYQMDDAIYPVLEIEDLLNVPRGVDSIAAEQRPALLVRDEAGVVHAVLVENVVDSRDLVVKGLGDYVPKLPGILGATILGDGSVTPVLDLPELLRSPVQANRLEPVADSLPVEAPGKRRALVVDDSLSVRRAMGQLVGDAGFEVLTARDGLEAVEILGTVTPDILLVDLEMPRMNGLELTSHVRGNAATKHLPVIMITSRSTDKHRLEAEAAGVTAYLTKPVSDDVLLGHLRHAEPA